LVIHLVQYFLTSAYKSPTTSHKITKL